jgi:hypothetical protein
MQGIAKICIRDNECDMAPESRNSPLPNNDSVSNFPRQRIDAVTDELFEMVVSIRFASKLQKESSVQFSSVQFSSVHFSSGEFVLLVNS